MILTKTISDGNEPREEVVARGDPLGVQHLVTVTRHLDRARAGALTRDRVFLDSLLYT